MATLNVPATYPTIAAALAVAVPTDTIVVAAGYAGNEVVTVGVNDVSFDVPASVSGIELRLASGIVTVNLLGASSIRVLGNSAANTIDGNAGDNDIDGGSGEDTMAGGAGNDTYVVQSAGDVVIEGANAGIDTVRTGLHYTLGVNVENLVLTGAGSRNGTGNEQDNVITGNSAKNTLDGGAGADTMIGGAGNDTYIVDNAGDVVVEAAGEGEDKVSARVSYTLSANVEELALLGTTPIDGTGNDLANTLRGTDGDNVLDGGVGADRMYGGGGNDTYYVDDVGDIAYETNVPGIDTVLSSITYALPTYIENLTLLGDADLEGTGNANDNILTGNDGDNILRGGEGRDLLEGGLGNDTLEGNTSVTDNEQGDTASYAHATGGVKVDLRIHGPQDTISAGFDTFINIHGLLGSAYDDQLIGNNGRNVLDGGAGADILAGGESDDVYYVDTLDLVVEYANEGTDWVYASFSYTLLENFEYLVLTATGNFDAVGNGANNWLYGNAGRNLLDGGAGADTMIGGAGDDTYIVDNAGDVVTEGVHGGIDEVRTSLASYTLGQDVENLSFTGSASYTGTGNRVSNIIKGGEGDDKLFGMSGYDTLDGGGGNDMLDGGGHADTMSGGSGDDVYHVDNIDDVVIENADDGVDTVVSAVNVYALTSNVEILYLTRYNADIGTGSTGIGNDLNNSIYGTVLTDWIEGGAGNDILDGGISSDEMYGGSGDDIYYIDHINDGAYETSGMGVDTVRSWISYTLPNNIERLSLLGTAHIDGTGNALANVLAGNEGRNILDGAGGDDALYGGAGDDILIGGTATSSGGNQLWGGTGSDTGFYVGTTAAVYADLGAQAGYVAGVLTDQMNSIENLTGGLGNDVLVGDATANVLNGAAGADALYGQDGDDTLIGGTPPPGTTNQLWGGSGSDTASYVGTGGTVHADLGALAGYVNGVLVDQMNSIENLTGGLGNNFLIGDAGGNILTGGASTDYLYGQDGNDTLIGGAAAPGDANQLWGGTGNDTASYAGTAGAVYADLGAQAGYVDGALVDLMNSIENLAGGSNADTLVGDAGANRLSGGAGGDALWGRGGADVFVYTAYADSNLVTGYDLIGDFVSGTSKLDLMALGVDASQIVIQSSGGSTSLYVEMTPGAFDASTDLAISFTGANAINLGDILL